MDNVLSLNKIKSKLKSVFCTENQTQKKYSQVWLSEANFGGLYDSNKYILNVKAEHKIPSCIKEIKNVVTILFANFSEIERKMIWRVVVYNSFEEIHCASEDILVYSEIDNCLK